MNYKARAIKDVLANIRGKGVHDPMDGAHNNPAVKAQENTPGKKVPLPIKGKKTKGKVRSKKPAFSKPKGTIENPSAAEKAGQVVAIPNYYKKAKTRKA